VLIQNRQFLIGTNAVQGSTAKIDRLSDWFCEQSKIDILLCDSANGMEAVSGWKL